MTTKPLSEVLDEYPQLVGPAGPQGVPGADGAVGAQGPQGIQGPQGPAGTNASLAWTLAGTWTYAGVATANVLFTGLGAAYEIMVEFVGITFDAAGNPQFLVSADGGVTYQGGTKYIITANTGITTGLGFGRLGASLNTGPLDGWMQIDNWNATKRKHILGPSALAANLTAALDMNIALNAIQMRNPNSNFNAGTINIYTR